MAILISILLWAGLISQDETITREKTFNDVSVNITGTDTMKRNGYIVVSDMSEALDSYAGIDRKSANLADDILPTMRRHMYTAYEMNKVLVETFGAEYSMLDTEQYESFEAIMKRFDQLLAAGQSTDPAKETLAVCMEDIKSSLAGRFTAEGNLLPKTASATTSSQP